MSTASPLPDVQPAKGLHLDWPFTALLIALLLAMAMVVIAGETRGGGVPLRLAMSVLLVAGVYVASGSHILLILGTILSTASLSAEWLHHFTSLTAMDFGRLAAGSTFYFFLCVVILGRAFAQTRVTVDTLMAGINVYLLLGLGFAHLHLLVEALEAGSYYFGSDPFRAFVGAHEHLDATATMMYYSFTTLTTLGYGDMRPNTSVAQGVAILEAVVGQLYVTIFIARLVSLQLVQSQGDS